jgi:hypothetical protein
MGLSKRAHTVIRRIVMNFTSIRLQGGPSPSSCRICSVHKRKATLSLRKSGPDLREKNDVE